MVDREVTSYDLDLLGEIGNIGAGNAATALSQILNMPVGLEVPMVKICKLTDIPYVLGGPEELRTGIFFGVQQSLNGYIMFILKDEDVKNICNIAAGGYDIEHESVVKEIANIISGAYVGAISSMIDQVVDITIPELGHDMIGSMVDSIISALCDVADKTVVIGTELLIMDYRVSGYYVLMLDKDSLSKLLNYFSGN